MSLPTTEASLVKQTRIIEEMVRLFDEAEEEGLVEHLFGDAIHEKVLQYEDLLRGMRRRFTEASDTVRFTLLEDYTYSDRCYEDQLAKGLAKAGFTDFTVEATTYEPDDRQIGDKIHIRVKFDKPISVARLQRAYDEFDMPGACKLVGETILMDSEVGDGT